MQESPVQRFKKVLDKKDISVKEFAQISGMPETEVHGIIEGNLSITTLRANHLAAAFDTEVEFWLRGDRKQQRKDEQHELNVRSKKHSLIGST